MNTMQMFLFEKQVGDTFKVGEYEFVVLEHDRITRTTSVILKDFLEISRFGDNCDFRESAIRPILESFADNIESIAGFGSLVTHTVDLTANDGLDDFGTIQTRASLMTVNNARKYVRVLDQHKPERWWWLITPYSTATHGYTSYVMCVTPRGGIDSNYCNGERGVRPFCIFKSNIFVS